MKSESSQGIVYMMTNTEMLGNNPAVWCHRNKTTSWQLNCSFFHEIFWHHKDPPQITSSSSGPWAVISVSIIVQVDLEKFAKPEFYLDDFRSSIAVQLCLVLFKNFAWFEDNIKLTSCWVYFFLFLTLFHTQKSFHSFAACSFIH